MSMDSRIFPFPQFRPCSAHFLLNLAYLNNFSHVDVFMQAFSTDCLMWQSNVSRYGTIIIFTCAQLGLWAKLKLWSASDTWEYGCSRDSPGRDKKCGPKKGPDLRMSFDSRISCESVTGESGPKRDCDMALVKVGQNLDPSQYPQLVRVATLFRQAKPVHALIKCSGPIDQSLVKRSKSLQILLDINVTLSPLLDCRKILSDL